MWRATYRNARRLVVFLLGTTIVLVGLAMLVLPGPGLLVVFVGLALLATEFVWARVWLRRLKISTKRAGRRARTWWRRGREHDPQP